MLLRYASACYDDFMLPSDLCYYMMLYYFRLHTKRTFAQLRNVHFFIHFFISSDSSMYIVHLHFTR